MNYQNIIIDNSLNEYEDTPYFQEKLDKANEVLKRVWFAKTLNVLE